MNKLIKRILPKKEKNLGEIERFKVLIKISKLINERKTEKEIINSLMKVLLEVLSVKRAALFGLGVNGQLDLLDGINYSFDETFFELNEKPTIKKVISSNNVVILKTNDKFNLNLVKQKIYLPLRISGQIKGVLLIKELLPGVRVKQGDIDFLQLILDSVGMNLSNVRLLKEKEKKITEISYLNEISREITENLELEKLLPNIIMKATELLNCEEGSILLCTKNKKFLEFKASFGSNIDKLIGQRIPIGEGIAGQVAKTKEPIILNKIKKPIYYSGIDEKTGFKTNSILCIPLEIKNEVFGVLEIVNKKEQKLFTSNDLNLLKGFARQASIAIENARLYELVEQQSIKDSLTNLFNRRYFVNAFNKEFIKAKRFKTEFSVLLMDLDHFKNYNDNNGHLEGDNLLKEFALILKNNLRAVDVIARYGGEEFIVLLPNAKFEESKKVAKKINSKIKEQIFSGEKKQPLGKVTVSIGITTVKDYNKSMQEIIDEADIALYKAKETGRDKSIHFSELTNFN